MDPQATWDELLDAWRKRDWQRMQEASESLLDWLKRGGFPPEVFPTSGLGSEWNRMVLQSACTYMVDLARRVIADPNGIPTGVPFTLSCFECSEEGPDTYDEAICEGWTEIEFRPECCAENFLGACPEHSE